MVENMSKLMKRIFLAAGIVGLLASSSLQAQENRGRWGLILGTSNGVAYDRTLGSHWEMGARATLGLGLGYSSGDSGMQFSGLIPAVEITPRYFFTRRDVGESYNRGFYFSLRMRAEIDQWVLFPSRAVRESARKYLYSLGFTPTIGWSFPLGETSAFRLGTGIDFYRQKYREGGVSEWRSNSGQGEIPIQLEATYVVAF